MDHWDVFSCACPSRAALDMVADKWAVLIVHALLPGTMRHRDLMDRIDGVSQKMLTQTLRELERAGLVEREVYAEVPPRVEYSLTALGRSLGNTVKQLTRWSEAHVGELLQAQQSYDAR